MVERLSGVWAQERLTRQQDEFVGTLDGPVHWTSGCLAHGLHDGLVAKEMREVVVAGHNHLYFRLPNELMLLRWRPGEPIDPPLLVATVTGPFVAFRDGAITVDEVGRVTIAFVPNTPGDLLGIRIE